MEKHLISLTTKQSATFTAYAKEKELSFSEIVRRAVDNYIESLVEKGDLIRHGFRTTDKSVSMDTPRKMFQELYDYCIDHPEGPLTVQED